MPAQAGRKPKSTSALAQGREVLATPPVDSGGAPTGERELVVNGEGEGDAMQLSPFMPPTPPASLPTSGGVFRIGRSGDTDVLLSSSSLNEQGEEGPEQYSDDREETEMIRTGEGGEPFALDSLELGPTTDSDWGDVRARGGGEEMDVEREEPALNTPFATANPNPFSASGPIHRPFRSRYAGSEGGHSRQSSLDDQQQQQQQHPNMKRPHSLVSPSSSLEASPPLQGPPSPPSLPPLAAGGALDLDLSLELPSPQHRSPLLPAPTSSSTAANRNPTWRRSFPTAPLPPLPLSSPPSSSLLSYDAQRVPVPPSSWLRETAGDAGGGGGILRRRARSSTATSLLDSATDGMTAGGGAAVLGTGRDRGSSKRRRSGTLSRNGAEGGGGTANGTGTGRRSLSCFPGGSTGAEPEGAPFPFLSSSSPSSSFLSAPTATTATARPPRLPPSLLRPRSPTAHPFLSPPSSSSSAFSHSSLLPLTASSRGADDTRSLLLSAARRSEELQSRGEGLLREAGGMLREAESLLRRRATASSASSVGTSSSGEFGGPAQPRNREGARARSTSLFAPPVLSASPPLLASPPSSPPISPPTSPGGSSSSASAATARARQFLTQLRARRPRLSRNGTAVEPPEMEREREREIGTGPGLSRRATLSGVGVGGGGTGGGGGRGSLHRATSSFSSSAASGATTTTNINASTPTSSPFPLLRRPLRSCTLPSPPPPASSSPLLNLDLDLETTPGSPEVDYFPTIAASSSSTSTSAPVLPRPAAPASLFARPTSDTAVGEDAQVARDRQERRERERRRVAEGFSAFLQPSQHPHRHPEPELSLWGEPTASRPRETFPTLNLRGPTQAANERWRRGEPPLLPSLPRPSLAETRTARPAGRRAAWEAARAEERDETMRTGTEEGDRHWWRTEESPSPERPVRRTLSLGNGENGSGGSRGFSFLDPTDPFRPSFSSDAAILPPFRLPRPANVAPPHSRQDQDLRRRSAPLGLFDEEEEEEGGGDELDRAERGGRGGAFMLSSGSEGVRPTPIRPRGLGREEGGEGGGGEGSRRSESPFGFYGPTHMTDPSPPARLPPFTFESRQRPPFFLSSSSATSSGATSRTRSRMPWDDPLPPSSSRFDPFRDLPGSSTSAATGTGTRSNVAPPRSSLADALARFDAIGTTAAGASSPSSLQTIRRRNTPTSSSSQLDQSSSSLFTTGELGAGGGVGETARTATVGDRLASYRQSRATRLAALRSQRETMRSLLGTGSGGGPASPTGEAGGGGFVDHPPGAGEAFRSASSSPTAGSPAPLSPVAGPSQSPRSRRFAGFLRALGGGGGGGGGAWERRGFAIWDEDFGLFGFARGGGMDSAAADPRNYLDDSTFDESYEALLRLSERIGDAKPKGVSKEKMEALRKFRYDAWPAGSGSAKGKEREEEPGRLAEKGVGKEVRCSICLCDYEDDDDIMLGDCAHGFHEECLTSWLVGNSSCPVCRRDHTA
ncbi:hypothetical protein JCM8547_000589 [Rhodosporidiobolus lusitaniae]